MSSVCPTAWECQAVRAPGVKCTQPQASRDGSTLRAWMASMYTSPVNHAAGPFTVGGFGSMFMTDVSLRAGPLGLRSQPLRNTSLATAMADMALGQPAYGASGCGWLAAGSSRVMIIVLSG
jgi:hypothetical protein